MEVVASLMRACSISCRLDVDSTEHASPIAANPDPIAQRWVCPGLDCVCQVDEPLEDITLASAACARLSFAVRTRHCCPSDGCDVV